MDDKFVAILGFFLDDEKHGYEVFKELSEKSSFNDIYTIKIGRLYSILNKLEQKEYLSSKIQLDGVKPPKKVYKITVKGKQTFNSWMVEPVMHGRDLRISLLMKLYFCSITEIFTQNMILENQIQECHTWLEDLKEFLQANDNNISEIEFLITQFRKSQIEGYISWLTWCRRRSLDD